MIKVAGSYKSRYKPSHPEKYKGNSSNIICRSNWERTFCKYCDLNENVISWASEEFNIPYVSPVDNRVHKYYPDFLIEVKENNRIKKYVIEIKPKKQTSPPPKKSRVTKSYIYECKTFEVNRAKWRAAREFCIDNGLEFKIITEEELYGSRGIPRKRKQ